MEIKINKKFLELLIEKGNAEYKPAFKSGECEEMFARVYNDLYLQVEGNKYRLIERRFYK